MQIDTGTTGDSMSPFVFPMDMGRHGKAWDIGVVRLTKAGNGGLTRRWSSRRLAAVNVRLAALVMSLKMSVVQQAARRRDSGKGWCEAWCAFRCKVGSEGSEAGKQAVVMYGFGG